MAEINEHNIYEFILQGRDREVIKYLYKKTFPTVKKSLLRKKASREDIEDVFQEAVMGLYKMIMDHKIEPGLNICGLLYTISINKWYNLMRKNNRQVLVDFQEDESYHTLSEEIGDWFLAKSEKNLLNTLFVQIGQKCIEMLNFTIYQDLSMEDIRYRMGLKSEASTKMQMKRCREKLWEQIENNPEILNRLLEYV